MSTGWLTRQREVASIIGIRDWLYYTLRLDEARAWCERVYYCHHNARVIANFEHRMACVLSQATGGQMSKPYYDKDDMLPVIDDYMTKEYSDGFDEGYRAACEEHGIEVPEKYQAPE